VDGRPAQLPGSGLRLGAEHEDMNLVAAMDKALDQP